MRSAAALALISVLVGAAATGAASEPATPAEGASAAEPAFDRASTLTSLRARIGGDVDGWTIDLTEVDPRRARAKLEREGQVIERTIDLEGETVEERSRELASALALLLDDPELAASESEGESQGETSGGSGETGEGDESGGEVGETPPASGRPAIWITLGPRLGLDRRINLDAGLELMAALELLRGHLQPLLQLGWSRAREASLGVDIIHLGGGLAAGTGLAKDRLWLGGGVAPRAMWVRVREMEREARIWSASSEVFGLGHLRIALGQGAAPQLQLSLRAGADVSMPPLIFTGSTAQFGRAQVRLALAFGVGLRW
ncbi:MAG: hypothetical protein H6711_32370 [Myxococcales bacterium]|nr:hypothetical protein [Myxococcales bacterium]